MGGAVSGGLVVSSECIRSKQGGSRTLVCAVKFCANLNYIPLALAARISDAS